jgi:MoaA/NifB/PqqE/SkfB family radical SAM enzyme
MIAELEIATLCTHRCAHCYIADDALSRRDSVFSDRDFIDCLLLELSSLGVEEIVVTGGEPTIHENYGRRHDGVERR